MFGKIPGTNIYIISFFSCTHIDLTKSENLLSSGKPCASGSAKLITGGPINPTYQINRKVFVELTLREALVSHFPAEEPSVDGVLITGSDF